MNERINELIKLYDKSDMLGSILALPAQINAVFADSQFDSFSMDSKKIHNVVVMGMGSSLIAFKIIEAVFGDRFTLPIFINNTYTLPKWVNSNTLIILSSYSGNSKETIACAKEAIDKKSIIAGITTGGQLGKILKDKSDFLYVIDSQRHNPCRQPRLAIGYSFASYLQILRKTSIVNLDKKELQAFAQRAQEVFSKTIFYKRAIKYAKQILEKNVHVISGDFLSGNAELFSRQLQWNAKQESSFSIIPEATHHINESISHPKSQKNQRIFIFLESEFFSQEISNAIAVLKKYLAGFKFSVLSIFVKQETTLGQAVEMMAISSLISYYAALLYNEDPTPTPGIKFHKQHA